MNLINIYNKGRLIHLFCRDSKGELSIKTENGFFPYFYELDKEGQFKSYDGHNLRKVFVSNPSDVPKTRTMNAYEADILFTRRYMIDKIDSLDKCPIKYSFIDIEIQAEELPDVQLAKQPITCISVGNSFTRIIKTFWRPNYNTEFELIEDFIKYMQKEKFDLWLSWNVKFDYNYLHNRYPDFPNKISPIGLSRYGDGDVFYPAGISIVDYLAWFKKITLNREQSYALDNIAQKHLKDQSWGKTDFSQITEDIKKKNINDIKRMVKLEEKFKIIPYFDEIRRLTKVEWEDMIWNSRILDMLLLQEAKNQSVVLPMRPDENRGTLSEKEEFAGAYREALDTGRFFNIGKYDLSSAYPMAIINFCLDPANIRTLNPSTDYPLVDMIKIENTYFEQNQNALLPTVVRKLITIKNNISKKLKSLELNTPEYKDTKKMYDAIKSVVNSAYGVFGNRFFRLYNKNVASATTFIVRSLLHYVQEKLELKGYKVIYVDTDSVFIDNKENLTDLCNDLVQQWGKEKFGKEKVELEFGYEGIYEKLLILTKCRYKGWLKTNKGIEIETKGIEAKRKDSTIYMKKFQTELIDKIVNKEKKENIFAWIKDEIKKMNEQPLQDISFPCKLSRKAEDYKNVPIFLRALNNSDLKKRVGEPFHYLFIKPDGYEEKEAERNTIMTYDKNGKEKGFKNLTLKRLNRVIEITNMDLRRISDGDELTEDERLEKLEEQGLYKSELVMIKGKAKDVIAFDEENIEELKNKVDYKRMIERNITMKLDTIFTAMKWDIKEIIHG